MVYKVFLSEISEMNQLSKRTIACRFFCRVLEVLVLFTFLLVVGIFVVRNVRDQTIPSRSCKRDILERMRWVSVCGNQNKNK